MNAGNYPAYCEIGVMSCFSGDKGVTEWSWLLTFMSLFHYR